MRQALEVALKSINKNNYQFGSRPSHLQIMRKLNRIKKLVPT